MHIARLKYCGRYWNFYDYNWKALVRISRVTEQQCLLGSRRKVVLNCNCWKEYKKRSIILFKIRVSWKIWEFRSLLWLVQGTKGRFCANSLVTAWRWKVKTKTFLQPLKDLSPRIGKNNQTKSSSCVACSGYVASSC